MRIPILFSILLASLAAQAKYRSIQSIVGWDQEKKTRLIEVDGAWRAMVSLNFQVDQQLNRIQPGDFLFALGELVDGDTRVHIHSIEKVGLKRLLGHWQSEGHGVFAFDSFNQLTLYSPAFTAAKTPMTYQPRQFLRYHVNPGVGNTWSIFIVGSDKITIGRFVLSGRRLQMIFIDQSSGEITDRLKLTKLEPLLP